MFIGNASGSWRRTSALALTTSLSLLPQLAFSQEKSPAGSAESGLQEVVVTAERRTVSLQKVNIAASALSSDDLEKKQIASLQAVETATPSLSVIDQGNTQSVNIRGIGLAVAEPQVDPGVAVYRDGVFLPTQTSLDQPFYDLDNLQVLRGPQGTYAGQDATGGAIYVNSKSPSLDGRTSGFVTAGYGNYNDVKVQGAANLPVSQTFAVRVAFNDENRDSFYKDISPTANGDQPGRLTANDLRIGLLWQPDAALSVLWKTEYDRFSNDSYPGQPIPGTQFYNSAPKSPFVIDYATPGLSNVSTYVLSSLQANYKFDNGITLKSNTGYQYNGANMLADQAASPMPGYSESDTYIERSWTEDLSLVSPDSGALRWVVGGTFFNYTIPLHAVEAVPGESTDIAIGSLKRSYGIFGSATYELTSRIELQAGLRYSADAVRQSGAVHLSIPAIGLTIPIPQGGPEYDDDVATGKIALNWNVDRDNLAYLFAAKGYKPGGTSGNDLNFAPETVWDYEAGWKTSMLDNHLRSQIGAFYMNYSKFQASEFNTASGTAAIANSAGQSTIAGFELQGQARLGGFGADGGLAYVHSSIGSLPAQVDTRTLPNGGQGLPPQCLGTASPPACFNYAPFIQAIPDGPNIYSPSWTANLGLQYAFEIGAEDLLTPRVDVSYTGQQWATFFESANDSIKSRTLVNLQLNYQHDDWDVQAYATNLLDKVYVSGFSTQFGSNYLLGAPRQFGLRVTRQF